MIKLKQIADCTIYDCVEAWNRGFEGYYLDATTTPDKFLKRMIQEDLSPLYSFVAFDNQQPIAIIKNGIRETNGKKIAWNGGTGVAIPYRQMGIGKTLIQESLRLFQKEKVDYATLEAISENQKAISLYEKEGYQIKGNLEYLGLNGPLIEDPFKDIEATWEIKETVPSQIGKLPFYKTVCPWQTQWQSAKTNEAILVLNDQKEVIGYAYYTRSFNEQGEHTSTTLYQCNVLLNHPNEEALLMYLLKNVFGPFTDSIRRVIPNLPVEENKTLAKILRRIGFNSLANQVFMIQTF
jgi:L-amino acid N-acyltransferase YncA